MPSVLAKRPNNGHCGNPFNARRACFRNAKTSFQMTAVIHIRLNDKEHMMLNEILSSEFCECENRSEIVRLWLHREWNKRKNLGVPKLTYQTAHRIGGRPPAPIYRTGWADQILSRTTISQRIPESKGASRISPHKAVGREISDLPQAVSLTKTKTGRQGRKHKQTNDKNRNCKTHAG